MGNTTKHYRTAKPIIIPAHTRVVYVSRMRQDIVAAATVLLPVGPHSHFDWIMYFDDALAHGLIEESPE